MQGMAQRRGVQQQAHCGDRNEGGAAAKNRRGGGDGPPVQSRVTMSPLVALIGVP